MRVCVWSCWGHCPTKPMHGAPPCLTAQRRPLKTQGAVPGKAPSLLQAETPIYPTGRVLQTTAGQGTKKSPHLQIRMSMYLSHRIVLRSN